MARIEIDGQNYDVKDSDNVLSACLGIGLNLPYFCWHPTMGSVGACRQCAVIQFKDADDQRGRIVMGCMTPIKNDMRLSIDGPQARQFRADNIELLMTNHPHDCPVCEEGGECHLQDMTVMTGHTFRRFRGQKRTHRNQNLGPFINHEMNRCITCYRCVRFYDDYAGGKDLQALGIHNNVYFGRFEDGTLESEFSGNLVEVCPTGVFTDKTFSAHYARKWDLQTAPSICVHCSVGCNIAPGERYGELRRVINRYHGEINGYFLCDRGRYGYGFVNSKKRIRTATIDGQINLNPEAAIHHFRHLLTDSKGIIGIGSPRASLEANFALRSLVGEEHYFLGLAETEHTLLNTILDLMQRGGIHSPSLREIEQSDAILTLGEDVTHSAPRMALSIRQSVRNAAFDMAQTIGIPRWQDDAIRQLPNSLQSPLFIASLCTTRLDDIATHTYQGSPDDIARLGLAIAHCLNDAAPTPSSVSEVDQTVAWMIADCLKFAQQPLIISGTSCSSLAVIQAAFNIAKSLSAPVKQLAFIAPECNSFGSALMGGGNLHQAFDRVAGGLADTVIALENDLYRRATQQRVEQFLNSTKHLIVIDSLENETAKRADLLLPAATFAESVGTLVNREGRAQRYYPVFPASEGICSSWQWLTRVNNHTLWQHHDALTLACAKAIPVLGGIIQVIPDMDFKIPRQPSRYSGRTAMHANISVSEPVQPHDVDSPFSYSMEGETTAISPDLLPVIWAPGWNSNQAINRFQEEIGGHLRSGDSGVRLIEASGDLTWFQDMPSAINPKSGIWNIISLPTIFGSEELSLQSVPILQRQNPVYVRLNPLDAETLEVDEGDRLQIDYDNGELSLTIPVQIEQTLPRGWVAITTNLPEFQGLKTWDQVTLKKGEQISQDNRAVKI